MGMTDTRRMQREIFGGEGIMGWGSFMQGLDSAPSFQ